MKTEKNLDTVQKNKPDQPSANPPKRKITSRQIAAMTGIVILVLMYVITLAAAVTDSSAKASWFGASLLATIAVPILIWIYVWMYGKLTGKSTIADPEPKEAQGNPSEEK